MFVLFADCISREVLLDNGLSEIIMQERFRHYRNIDIKPEYI